MPNAHEENTVLDNDASHTGIGAQISTSEIEIALILFLDGMGVYNRASLFAERRGLMGDEERMALDVVVDGGAEQLGGQRAMRTPRIHTRRLRVGKQGGTVSRVVRWMGG